MSRTASSRESGPDLSSKERYQKVLNAVEYNTSGPDTQLPAGAKMTTIQQIAGQHGYYDGAGIRRARTAAISNRDLLIWRDRDGRVRLTRTDEDSLRDLVAEENLRDDTCVELVEECRQLIADPSIDGGDLGVE